MADIQRLLLTNQPYTRLKNGKWALLDTWAVEELQEVLRDCSPQQHMSTDTTGAGNMTADPQFIPHPAGLRTLFFTEMWERFSYYGMRAFLILYMVAPVPSGGLGFADVDAASIYGTYTGSAWGASILGGLVADRDGAENIVLEGCIRKIMFAANVSGLFGTNLQNAGFLHQPGDFSRDALIHLIFSNKCSTMHSEIFFSVVFCSPRQPGMLLISTT